jgi:adenylyltransferase/sulfurtransferase
VRDHFQEFEISPEIVREMMDSGEEFVLVDVREDWEWEKAHLEGAIHIPLAQLRERAEDLSREVPAVVYDHKGDRSIDACLLLWEEGFRKVRSLSGGIELWSEVIDPEVPRY